MMRGGAVLLGLSSVVGSLAAGGHSLLSAQELVATETASLPGAATFRQVFVPADDPESWPAGDWRPILWNDYLSLRGRPASSGPSDAFLDRVRYRARFTGDALRGGRLEASVRLRSKSPRFVDLGSPTLALSNLRWDDDEAIWGLAPDGRSLLRVESDGATLAGRWSLTGTRVLSSIDFDVRVLPAVVSQFEIDLPDSHELTAETGLISGVNPSSRTGWKTWMVDLGHRVSCRLTVKHSASASGDSSRELEATQVAKYSLRADGVQLETDVTIQGVVGSFDNLEFTVPQRMSFSPVTVGGDVVLPSERLQVQQASLLRVDVRGIDLKRGTTIRLRGQMSSRPLNMPRIGLRQARWLSIRKQVLLSRPLQLIDLQTSGAVLSDSTMSRDAGAVLDFEDYSRSSRISVTVDAPRPDFSAAVLSEVDWRREDPLLRTTLRLSAQSGSSYTLSCRVPDHWEVTRVEPQSSTPVAQWSTSWDEREQRTGLLIEMSNAMTPQLPVEVLVFARPTAALSAELVDMPVVLPLVSGESDVDVAIVPPLRVDMSPLADSAYVSTPRDVLQKEWSDVSTVELLRSPSKGLITLHATDPPLQQPLRVSYREDEDGLPIPENDVRKAAAGGPPVGIGSGDASQAEVEANSPLSAEMTVRTTAAVERGGLCRTRVDLHLAPVAARRTLSLRLPRSVKLLSASSDSDATVAGNEVVVPLLPTEQGTVATLVYESPLHCSLVSGHAEIPLPEWDGVTTLVVWDIVLPDHYSIMEPTSGSGVEASAGLTWSQRLLGPLGRPSSGQLFWPFSLDVWRGLLTSKADEGAVVGRFVAAGEVTRSRSLLGRDDYLRVSFWNVSASRQFGWVVCLFTLLVTAWPFGPQRPLSRGWTLGLVLIGFVAALLAPDFLAIPWGGFVVGALTGALLPDRWRYPVSRHSAGRRSDPSPTTRTFVPISATASCLVLALSMLAEPSTSHGWQTVSPDSGGQAAESNMIDVLIPLPLNGRTDPPTVVYLQSEALLAAWGPVIVSAPPTLLRSVTYDLHDFDRPQPRIKAAFDVLVASGGVAGIAIPLTDVLFDESDACRVDGEVAEILPHRSGVGIVVELPPLADEQTGESAPIPLADAYRAMRVELTFRTREADVASRPRLDVNVPPVLDSHVTLRADTSQEPAIDVAHRGATTRLIADGSWRVDLGALPRLTADPAVTGTGRPWLIPIEAASAVEVHPLRLQFETRLEFTVDASWDALVSPTLSLQLPPRSIVREVRAAGLTRMVVDSSSRGVVSMALRFGTVPRDSLVVELSYDIPTATAAADTTVTIPPISFTDGRSVPSFPVHLLGVVTAPGFQLAAADPEGMLAGATGIDESRLPNWRGPRRSRTAAATFRQHSPAAIELPLSVVEPDVSASIRQLVALREARVEWAADVDITVRDAGVAFHRFKIDPQISVRQVNVVQENVDRAASWSRSGVNELIVFLTERLSGTQTVRLSGALTVADRREFDLPSIRLRDALPRGPSELILRHPSDLTATVESADGAAVTVLPSVMPDDIAGTQSESTVDVTAAELPCRVRFTAVDRDRTLDEVTIIHRQDDQTTDWTSHLRLSCGDASPGPFEIHITPRPDDLTIDATAAVVEVPGDDELLILRIDCDDASIRPLEVSLGGRVDGNSPLPRIQLAHGSASNHYVLAPQGMDVGKLDTAAQEVDVDSLPVWMKEQIEDPEETGWQAWVIGDPDVPPAAAESGSDNLSLRSLDSGLWARRDGGWQGLTVAAVAPGEGGTVTFQLSDGIKLWHASVDNIAVLPGVGGKVDFPVPAGAAIRQLTLWWETTGRITQQGSLRLPQPVDVPLRQPSPSIVVFGQPDVRYQFENGASIPASDVRHGLQLLDARAVTPSPLLAALQASEAIATSGPDAGGFGQSGPVACRMSNASDTVVIRSYDRQLLRLFSVIAAAAFALVLWYVLGRWIDIATIAQDDAGRQLTILTLLAAAIWLWGSSIIGFVLMVICGGLRVREALMRRSRKSPDSRLVLTG